MAERSEKKADRVQGPELRLIDRRAFVGFPELKVAPGVVITDFALQIPDVTFPFNVSGGASKYQRKKLDFGFLELSVDAEVVARKVQELSGKLAELDDLKLHFRPGYLEAQARLRGVERAALTFKIAFDGEGDGLAVYLYDVRFYAYAPTPASRIPAIVSDAVKELDVLPEVQRRGANGFSTRLLPPLVEAAAVARGFKMPSLDNARLVEASVSSKGVRLRFAAGGLPPPATPDEELLLTLEGARAFADAEEALANGKLKEAREQYLKLGDANEAHPFAVERLLTILVADPTAHELALDIAASLQARRDKSATALWAEAVVRERRGEFARAAERYLALCNLARRNQEEAGAFFAAEAGARAGRDHAPQMAAKALHELLGIRPDHLPSLKALARASDQAKDRAGAMRAYRRLAALARDPAEAADAHVQLARLAAATEDDIAGARLHCEAALRLSPDHPDALSQLAELCFQGGEHLRAIKAVDRLRDVAMARHEVDRIGHANVLAGKVWELGLKQPENALLRYREAVSLLPGEPEPLFFSARVAEGLGKLQESVSGYQQTIELAGPAPRTDGIRVAAHQSHHALARLYKTRLGEPARARDHLEAALQLQATDLIALDELLPYYRASGKALELADAAEKAASVLEDPQRRAALWAEAGELYRGRLAQPEKADRLLSQALEADPKNRSALEGMLALAESRRDGGQLCRCLKALAEIAEDAKERVRYFRRLAVAARDLAFDLDLAAHAYTEVLKVERDDLPALGELCALQRRRSDWAGLSWALEQRAAAAEAAGDKRLAAAALRELSQIQEARLGRAGEALVALEKAARLFPEANTLLELANLSLRCERPLNARRALEDVLALLPKHAAPERLAEVRARLGRACDLLGDKDGARENYAMAFPLRRLDDELAGRLEQLYEEGAMVPELTDLWASRAQALLQAGRGQDAAPLFFKSAQALLKAGDPAGAVLRLSAALDAAPTGERAAETLEAMAELELNRGEKLEAAKLFARRAALSTEARPAARLYFKAATLAAGTAREEGYLQSALQQDISFIPARLRRAELQLQTDPRTALVDLEAVLEADPKDPDVAGAHVDRLSLLRKAGFAALASGQLDSGRRLLALYVAQKPEDVEATLELASLHRKSGAVEPLVDLLAELWPRLEGAPRKAARKEYAEGSLSLGRTGDAVEVLRSILADEPQDVWAATKLLTLLPVEDSTTRERSQLISRLIDTAQGEARAELLSRRSDLNRQVGDLIAARADLLDAAQLSSRPLPLLRSLASLARQTKDEVAELAAWKLALKSDQRDEALQKDAAERLIELARTRQDVGDGERAREAFEALVSLPLSPSERHEAWYGLARTALGNGDRTRAESALLEASKVGPAQSRVAALLERAQLLEGREAKADAVTAYESALALAPKHPAAVEGLKKNLRALADYEGLAEVIATEAAAAPKPKAAALFRELFHLYSEQLGAKGPAEAALRRVVALDENDLSAKAHLASILAERGELDESTALLEQAAAGMEEADAARLLRDGAAQLRKAGDRETALRLLRKAHERQAATGADLADLAELLFLLGAVKEALPLQTAVAEAARFDDDPEGAEGAYIRLADLAEQTKNPALAESALRRVVKERPLSQAAAERLAGLVAHQSPREALGILADWASQLSRSPRAEALLLTLARRAQTEVADVDLAAKLFEKAAVAAENPLPIRTERAALLRDAGKSGELMQELLEIAQAKHGAGDVEGALEAWQEEAGLAEGLSRVDEALRTLQAMAEVCEEEGLNSRGASLMRRRAELLTDSKLDLEGAQGALEKAWDLSEDVATARLGMELARRRSDRESEIDWLERTMKSVEAPPERALAFVQLARLHVGMPAEGGELADAALLAPDQAEASLKEALKEVPGFAPAEGLLIGLYERQERLGDVAAYYEESALRSKSTAERARLLLKAAELYKDRANKPHEAAAALLAARAANPDDTELTAKVADQLHALGRVSDAADFDALLLESDPFHPAFARHKKYLQESDDLQALAALLMRRAQAEVGEAAAATWLEASQAFVKAGAPERARLCEDQAFEAAPTNDEAFEALKVRAADQPRRLADLLAARARAKPEEAPKQLRERAVVLQAAKESLAAAEAWDEYLQVSPDDLEALEERGELASDAGGAKAAQPFDRKLIQLGGEKLPPELRRRVWMRLGNSALESEAWRDAADAFEQAFQLDSAGERGKESLSLLAEAASRSRDNAALYRTTLRLAERSSGEEEEALYRRAASLFDEPFEVIDALTWLAKNRPAEDDIYDRTKAALKAAGKLGDLLELHERHAGAAGGPRGAAALLEAAELAEGELKDTDKANDLRVEASRLDPDNVVALGAVVAQQRKDEDETGLLATLPRLAEALTASDAETANGLRLELAALLEKRGELAAARVTLGAIRSGGASTPGYGASLEALERILKKQNNTAALADVLAARAELATSDQRSQLLLRAAHAAKAGDELVKAVELVRASLAAKATPQGLLLLAELSKAAGQTGTAATALVQAALLSEMGERPKLLLEAAETWEAAGEKDEALGVLQRLQRDHPDTLTRAQLAERMLKLGAKREALEVAFAPAMASQDFDEALEWAEAAQDEARIDEALWELSAREGDGKHAQRLAERLRTAQDFERFPKLARLMGAGGTRLWLQSFERGNVEALDELTKLGQVGEAAAAVFKAPQVPLLEALLPKSDALDDGAREQLWRAIADRVPEKRPAMLGHLADLYEKTERWADAAKALGELAAIEEDATVRSDLQLERGALLRDKLKRPELAREAFEQALADDANCAPAIEALTAMYAPEGGTQLTAMAERLEALKGKEALEPYREQLAQAYEEQGKKREAFGWLSGLPETPERLEKRAALASELGMTGESLQLREKVAKTETERAEILVGYLKADLVPFAVRLGEKMLDAGELDEPTLRLLAERLAPTEQGAALSVRAWPRLLMEKPSDADGWTLYGEALRLAKRESDASLADGFGGALTASQFASPIIRPDDVDAPDAYRFPELPSGLLPVTEKNMPRLSLALYDALTGLGAKGMTVALDPMGGAEAWQGAPQVVVIGAGALALFGPSELTYLCALAIALGEEGHKLREPGEVEGLTAAAVAAFEAYPVSLAAGRVLAHLDSRVRGSDPATIHLNEVLPDSAAFIAVAKKAVEILEG